MASLNIEPYGDCLAWCFTFIQQCQQFKREIILPKQDFAKAFDTIEHNTILDIMKHMGFLDKWLVYLYDFLFWLLTNSLEWSP
jgi:hypothetical protein